MSLHQYIGARYVPRFMGAYDAGTIYEALDVVDNGLGTSYIARKPVPAGTPLSNTSYWAVYGASSGAIINLQNQINDIIGDLGDLTKLETPIKTDIVSAINSRERKYVFIADSYGVGAVSDDGTNIISHFIDRLGLVNTKNITSYALGSHGFVANGSNTFISILTNNIYPRFLDSSLDFTADEVTDVIVCGGDNDWNIAPGTIETAIRGFVNQAKTYFPNCTVWVGEVGNVTSGNHLSIGLNPMAAYPRVINAGGKYLTGVEKIMLDDSYFMPDGIHPKGTGMKEIGYAVADAVTGAPYTVYRYQTGTVDTSVNDFGITGGTINYKAYSDGDQTILYLDGILSANGAMTITNKRLGTINCSFINGMVGGMNFSADIIAYSGGGNVYRVPCTLFIDGKVIYIIPQGEAPSITGMTLRYAMVKFPAKLN